MLFNVATWNVNSIKVRHPSVLNWLSQNDVDVLALQETKSLDENFPSNEFAELGYNSIIYGEKQYNGVALLTKGECENKFYGLFGENDEPRRLVACTVNGVRCISVYIPNGETLESDKFEYKLVFLEKLLSFLKEEIAVYKHVVLMGDFNIAPADIDVYDAEVWQDRVLVSEPERDYFQQMLNLGFVDVFRHLNPSDAKFSWWNYRTFAYRRNRGLRIDHILATDTLIKSAKVCSIDENPRKEERPSDHTVVQASFDLKNLI